MGFVGRTYLSLSSYVLVVQVLGVPKEKKKKKKRKSNKHTDVPITAFFICTISFWGGKATHYLISPHLPIVRVFPCRWAVMFRRQSNFTP